MASSDPIELLYRALASEIGIVVETDDPVRLKQQLYAARAKDPDLACLSFLTSPLNPQGQVLITKKDTTP
jgi:hypothetical protein